MSKLLALGGITFGLIMIFMLVLQDTSRPEMVSDWATPYSRSIPENTPVVGLWMDNGQPVVLAVVAHGTRYFEYDALHPMGPASMLYGYPPMWWTPMPGGAK